MSSVRTPVRPTPLGCRRRRARPRTLGARSSPHPTQRVTGGVCTQAPCSVLAGKRVGTGGTKGSGPRSQDAGRSQSGQRSAGEMRIREAWEHVLLSVITRIRSRAVIPDRSCQRPLGRAGAGRKWSLRPVSLQWRVEGALEGGSRWQPVQAKEGWPRSELQTREGEVRATLKPRLRNTKFHSLRAIVR